MRIPPAFVLLFWSDRFSTPLATAQTPKTGVLLLEKHVLGLDAAREIVAAAEAERNHWRGVVAVVDDGGWLIMLERMDHTAMTA